MGWLVRQGPGWEWRPLAAPPVTAARTIAGLRYGAHKNYNMCWTFKTPWSAMSSIKSPFREDLCKNYSIIYLWSTCSRRGEPVEPKHLVLLHLLLHSHSLYPLPTPPDTQCTATARTRPTFELDRHPALLGCEINMKIMCKNWAHSPCLVSETDHSCLVVLYAHP